jgi:hypothetical protein
VIRRAQETTCALAHFAASRSKACINSGPFLLSRFDPLNSLAISGGGLTRLLRFSMTIAIVLLEGHHDGS